MGQPQCVGGRDGEWHRRLTLAGQDVEHDVAADGALAKRFGTGGLDRFKAVTGDGGQDSDHLTVAIGVAAKAATHPVYRGRQ